MSIDTITELPIMMVLLLLMLVARVLGEIFERMGHPAMIGEVLAGCILGPSLLNMIHSSDEIRIISELGVFFLVILAGMEIGLDEMRQSFRLRNVWIPVLGFSIPMLSGMVIGYSFNFGHVLSLFLGLCIAITALPVSVRILMDIGKLNSPIGKQIISAAIFNDVVALLVLGIIMDFNHPDATQNGFGYSLLFTGLKFIFFLVAFLLLHQLFLWAKNRVSMVNSKLEGILTYLKGKESLVAMVILFVLLFANFTEALGLHFVIGAFFGAMFLNKDLLGLNNYDKVKNNLTGITMGFLAPVFFASIGIEFNLYSLTNLVLLAWVVIASFVSKIAGGYIGGRFAGFSKRESLTLGIGLNARGIMELVIANIALQNGFIDISVYSILVLMGMITTLMSPILLKKAFALSEHS